MDDHQLGLEVLIAGALLFTKDHLIPPTISVWQKRSLFSVLGKTFPPWLYSQTPCKHLHCPYRIAPTTELSWEAHSHLHISLLLMWTITLTHIFKWEVSLYRCDILFWLFHAPKLLQGLPCIVMSQWMQLLWLCKIMGLGQLEVECWFY